MAEILSMQHVEHKMYPFYADDRIIYQCFSCGRRTQVRMGPGDELPFVVKPGVINIHHNY